MSTISPLDFIQLQLGRPGYYLIFISFLLYCLQLPIVFSDYLFHYYNYIPPHRCRLLFLENENGNNLVNNHWKDLNIHKNEWYPRVNTDDNIDYNEQISIINYNPMINQLLPPTASPANRSFSSKIIDQCHIYLDPIEHWKGKQSCPNGYEYWYYGPYGSTKNLITEFDLVCGRRYLLVILNNSIHLTSTIGSLLFGILADRYGRCKILNLSIYLFIASSLSLYFVQDVLQFIIFYNLQIFFIYGLQIVAYILLLELYPTPLQLKANFLWFITHSLTLILISTIAMTLNDWRYMQLSIAVPSLAFITYLFVLPSSPLWQIIVANNHSKALKTLKHFSKFTDSNTISLNQMQQHLQNLYSSTLIACTPTPSMISPTFDNQHSNSLQSTTIITKQSKPNICKPAPLLRWFLLTNFYFHFIVTVLDSKLFDPYTMNLNPSPHMNLIYNRFIDLSLIILIYHLTLLLNTRSMQSILFFLNGSMITISIVLNEYFKFQSKKSDFDYRTLLIGPFIMVLARSFARILVVFISFHTIKTIPTNIRATGLACCMFWIQIAKLSVPHLLVLAEYLPHNSLQIMFSLLSISNTFITLMYPSNMQQNPLPNTLKDLETSETTFKTKSTANNRSTLASSTLSTSLSQPIYPCYRDPKHFNSSVKATALINDESYSNTLRRNQNLRPQPTDQDLQILDQQQQLQQSFDSSEANDLIIVHGNAATSEHLSISSSSSASNGGQQLLTNGQSNISDSPSDSFIISSSSAAIKFNKQKPKQLKQPNSPSYIQYNNNIDPFIVELENRLKQDQV